MEEWKDVPGFEGLYQVSNYGRVKSAKRNQVIKLYQKCGYLQTCLYKNGIQKWCLVHRLVWSAFNGPIQEGMQVNHISERKCENNLENLNLMTAKENNNWGTHYQRSSKTLTNRKDKSKQIQQFTKDGELLNTYPSAMEAHRQTGIHRSNICSCCRGTKKSAGGYIWKFA